MDALNIIDHRVVTAEERKVFERHGGCGSLTARCICFGWLGFNPAEVLSNDALNRVGIPLEMILHAAPQVQ